MVRHGILLQLEAKPGKEAELGAFLAGALPLAQQEPATLAWFAIQLGPNRFGVFDAFPDPAGRQAHIDGEIAKALMARAGELLAERPNLQLVDILAAKLPG